MLPTFSIDSTPRSGTSLSVTCSPSSNSLTPPPIEALFSSAQVRNFAHLSFLLLNIVLDEGPGTLSFLGFDACEHETDSMSRYGMKLPVGFYHRFATDISRFANAHTAGRLLSVLEGGYSERTLISSSLSYLLGHLVHEDDEQDVAWTPDRLDRLSQLVLCSPNASAGPEPELITHTRALFAHLDGAERAKVDMRAELRKSARAELGVSQTPSAAAGMKLRSGRLASAKIEPADQSIEGLFNRLAIGGAEAEEISPSPRSADKTDDCDTDPGPASPEVKQQRLKLVWKAEGING